MRRPAGSHTPIVCVSWLSDCRKYANTLHQVETLGSSAVCSSLDIWLQHLQYFHTDKVLYVHLFLWNYENKQVAGFPDAFQLGYHHILPCTCFSGLVHAWKASVASLSLISTHWPLSIQCSNSAINPTLHNYGFLSWSCQKVDSSTIFMTEVAVGAGVWNRHVTFFTSKKPYFSSILKKGWNEITFSY